ncbi:MAG TPA: formyltransferase [Accumulibacter sp.]|uniref:formyltransferase n=1 Tax=Accumulibacter sp. TaxID=2053492 RepID=UPI0025F0C357|nr:formyltransferase [Accumulibacter sp.]MCM8598957.1 formyltransferase [Accumulibacter sp.]MCM8662352.1 formyltransferase [Accumulibacter sp.]HNC52352.1 formyltransferase [Accumulibacter sp.]
MSSAVVFAYHNVGVRCLRALLAGGVDVRLVVTHEDDPGERIWFSSVRQLCAENDIPCIAPDNANTPEIEARVAALDADFLFSFYYRHMLKSPLLQCVRRGAYNMHGSLLPRYRGRAPVNWAVLHGERETGATLHQMTVKPDNGPIVDQFAVPILPDDTAQEVFQKVTVAAELCLTRTLPKLIEGSAEHRTQDLTQGAYFGGRRAEDGRIDWQQNARQIHNLVRAVSRPYPGAFSDFPAGRLVLWRTRVIDDQGLREGSGMLANDGDCIEIHPRGGGILRVLEGDFCGLPLHAGVPAQAPGSQPLPAPTPD